MLYFVYRKNNNFFNSDSVNRRFDSVTGLTFFILNIPSAALNIPHKRGGTNANRRVSILTPIPPLSKRFLLSNLPVKTADRRIWRMMAIVRRYLAVSHLRRPLLNQWYLFQPRHNYFIIRIVILFVRLIGITLENTTNSLLYIPGITSLLPFIILR